MAHRETTENGVGRGGFIGAVVSTATGGVGRGGFIGTVASTATAAAAATATFATTIRTGSGHVVTVSDFILQFEATVKCGPTNGCFIKFPAVSNEAAKSRLNRMNERLRQLEQQMETLEAQIWKANDPFDSP